MNYLIHENELSDFMTQRELLIFDLRDGNAYRKYHLDGAINVPVEKFGELKKTLPRRKKVLLYCEHGNDSLRETIMLRKRGYWVYTLVGGISILHRNQIDSVSGKR